MNKLLFAALILSFAPPLFAVQDLNTPRSFPKIESKAEWKARAENIREQALVSCGLWPMPEKTPLKAHVFGKLVRDGYTIEKVYFESYPGFFVAGNLYRPIGKGPFPGVLNPHGHWEMGRLTDTETGSAAARCINFAKQGMVAFTYDMVGYNDTFFPDTVTQGDDKKNLYKRHRSFGTNATDLLWNINLMGLQTWNSIRALDFLESLPDVDKSQLACTGESGGGTQTFMLGAIDDRLAAQAPIVMVSHSMQGGCSCENAPGLRIEYSNMEIAAAAAPRPQLMVGATGDWTKTTMTIEGPGVASVYRLLNHEDRLRYKIFDFPHNYNKTTREAVYQFFGETLKPGDAATEEAAYVKETDETLRVFPDDQLPEGAVTAEEMVRKIVANDIAQLERVQPRDKKGLAKYKKLMTPAWKHTLQLEGAKSPAVEITYFTCAQPSRGVVVLADAAGSSAFMDDSRNARGLAKTLGDRGFEIMVIDAPTIASNTNKQVDLFYTTYNRTFAQERVRDLVNAAGLAKQSGKRVILCGKGRAGLWAMLAASAADAVVADCAQLDSESDAALLQADLFIPGLRKIGAFTGAALLAVPHPVLLHNTGGNFQTKALDESYVAVNRADAFRDAKDPLNDEQIAIWIVELK